MKTPTKRQAKSFIRQAWNAKEIYLLIIIVIGGAWMMSRVAHGIEKQAAEQNHVIEQ